MQGYGYLYIVDYAVSMAGTGSLSINIAQQASVIMSGEGALSAFATSNYGYSTFPKLSAFGGYYTAYGAGDSTFPAFESYAEGGLYVPTITNYGFAILPGLVSSGFLHTVSPITGDSTIPAMAGIACESTYGEGDSTIPALVGYAVHDMFPFDAPIYNRMIALNGIAVARDYIVFINNSGTITSTIEGSRLLIDSVLVSLNVSGTISTITLFLSSMLDSLSITDSEVASVGDGTNFAPAVDASSRVWVVNIDTGATSQYDDYGYASFYSYGGKNYGVAEDGIYELTGNTDNGVDIDALVDFGRTDLGSMYKKRVTSAYVDVGSDGKMELVIETDGQTSEFEANSFSAAVSRHRINMGSTLSGYYWNPILTNNNGYDFNLASIMLEIMQLNRRL